jgi:hypothetical protein
MKTSSILVSIILFAGSVSTASLAFAQEPYLFDMLKHQAYKKSWNTLFIGEKDVDIWLIKHDGPAGPGKIVTIGNTRYQTNTVCKTHQCVDHQFVVLFAPKGKRAWGLLLKDKKDERYFGNPNDEIKKALRVALKND